MALKHSSGGAVFIGTGESGDIVITPVGEVDSAFAPTMLVAIREAIAEAPRRILFDLASVTFLDSAGCDVLAVACGEARAAGIRVALREDMTRMVRRVLAATMLLADFDPELPSLPE
jgi:anti-anti-sigma factor